MTYQIRLLGHIGHHWLDWHEKMTTESQANGETVITVTVADQAALYGLLSRIRDLGMPLLSVIYLPSVPTDV